MKNSLLKIFANNFKLINIVLILFIRKKKLKQSKMRFNVGIKPKVFQVDEFQQNIKVKTYNDDPT